MICTSPLYYCTWSSVNCLSQIPLFCISIMMFFYICTLSFCILSLRPLHCPSWPCIVDKVVVSLFCSLFWWELYAHFRLFHARPACLQSSVSPANYISELAQWFSRLSPSVKVVSDRWVLSPPYFVSVYHFHHWVHHANKTWPQLDLMKQSLKLTPVACIEVLMHSQKPGLCNLRMSSYFGKWIQHVMIRLCVTLFRYTYDVWSVSILHSSFQHSLFKMTSPPFF